MFEERKLDHSFRSLKYLGLQTINPPTNYNKLHDLIICELENLELQHKNYSPVQLQTPRQIYENFQKLNNKFCNEVVAVLPPFSVRILECNVQCELCREFCRRSMNHTERHSNTKKCVFDSKRNNKCKLCSKCYRNREEEVPVTEYDDTSSTYGITSYLSSIMPFIKNTIINCPVCGEIYKSSTTKLPEENFVFTEVIHMWPGHDAIHKAPIHSGQKVMDSFTWFRDTVSTYTAVPVKCTKICINNITKPEYWRKDEEVHKCHNCETIFERYELSKHHCRDCGEIFCNTCTTKRAKVPHRGWMEPSRVCDDCHRKLSKGNIGKKFLFILYFNHNIL